MNTKDKFLGLLRELLTAGGALAFGAYEGLPSIIGLIISIFAVGWAIRYHEGNQILATSIRKTLSLVPGVLLALKWVDPNTAGLIAAFLAPLFAMIWSYWDKSDIDIPKGSGLALFALSSVLAISMVNTSCSNIPNDFLKGVSVRVKTDAGDIVGYQDGIKGEIVIDQTSGK